MMMNDVIQFLSNMRYVPIWVWGVLAFLLYRGIKETRTRWVWLPRLLLFPLCLLFFNSDMFYDDFLNKFIIFTSTTVAGLVYYRFITEVDVSKCMVLIPGNYNSLMSLLIAFGFKFYMKYREAMVTSYEDVYNMMLFAQVYEIVIYSLSGVFFARFLRALYVYYQNRKLGSL